MILPFCITCNCENIKLPNFFRVSLSIHLSKKLNWYFKICETCFSQFYMDFNSSCLIGIYNTITTVIKFVHVLYIPSLQQRNVPVRFVSMTAFHPLRLNDDAGPGNCPPPLLTRKSIFPNFLIVSEISLWTWMASIIVCQLHIS